MTQTKGGTGATIHAQMISGGQIKRDELIFAPHDSRHGELLPAIAVHQEKHYLFCLADIWARRLDIEYFNFLGLIWT